MRRVALVLAAALLLAGCGFHLRQPAPLPEALTRVHVQGTSPHGELAYELSDALADAGAEAVSPGEPAGAVLDVTGERYERLVASVDSNGRVTQYELRYTLSGSLRESGGAALAPAQSVQVRKLLDSNPNNALGTASEEELLQREMRHQAARQLLRQFRTALEHRPATP